MSFYLVAEYKGTKAIFGRGNTNEMAWVSGRWNVGEYGGKNPKVVSETRLSSNVKWFDSL